MTDCLLIKAAQLSIGCIVDPETRQPVGPHGITVTRRSRGLKRQLAEHAQPLQLVGLPETLSQRIAPTALNRGALIVYPIYEQGPDGIVGQHMVVGRIGAHRFARAGGEGQALSATSLIIDWTAWQVACQNIGALLEGQLDITPVTTEQSSTARLDADPICLQIQDGKIKSNHPPVLERIVTAMREGNRLILGRESCDTEAEFLVLMSAALAELPTEMRPHVSFASGYIRHEGGLQIVWMPDRTLSADPLAVIPARAPKSTQLLSEHMGGKGYLVSLVDGRRGLMASVRIAMKNKLSGPNRRRILGAHKPIDRTTLLCRHWLPPTVLSSVLASHEAVEAIAESMAVGDTSTYDLVLLTGAIAEISGPAFSGLGIALLRSVLPLDRSARNLTPDRFSDPGVLNEVVRHLEAERLRLARSHKSMPRWLTKALHGAALLIMASANAAQVRSPKKSARSPAG